MNQFSREQKAILISRLREEPIRLIIVIGPRQAGKTTMVRQALTEFRNHYVSADEPSDYFMDSRTALIDDMPPVASRMALATQRNGAWLEQQWETARNSLVDSETGFVLAIDEVQKIPNWSEVVKGLWDKDRRDIIPLHVVLLGSALLLLQKGLEESLAGRYEFIRLTHWSYPEMSALADIDLSQYVYFGGYPGATSLIHDESRWRVYIQESLIQPILSMTSLRWKGLTSLHCSGVCSNWLHSIQGKFSPTQKCWEACMMPAIPRPLRAILNC